MEKLTKKQLKGLRHYRSIMVNMLAIITFISLFIKVGLNPLWHLNDIVVEIVTSFILIVMGILSNIRNDFPIFHARSLKLSKEFAYSLTCFFTMTLLFIIYKNIVEPDFVSYIAGLSFHDLCTLLVFLLPVALLVIVLIYFSFRMLNDVKKEKAKVYSDDIERSINKYKVLTVKSIYMLMLLSLWAKIGLNNMFTFNSVIYELVSVIVVSVLFVCGNISNKLEPLHNFHFKIDRYFFISLLLPYVLIIIYSIFNSDFRFMLLTLNVKNLISIIVYMSPILLFASSIFYFGCKYPKFINNRSKKKVGENKVRLNALISLLITLVILCLFFLYSVKMSSLDFSVEDILQVIMIYIPLGLIIYLVLYSGIKEINK